uniref:Reverse transcriptase zinc-binding domain-containing protein n=1 Tax=Brassica oleracea TaxID=3712 RepID=A0A3P6D8H2_BRAOL|nr:unnamed protein product [Brassica oleracea]
MITGVNLNAVVADALRHGGWIFERSRSRNPIISFLRESLPASQPIIELGEDDQQHLFFYCVFSRQMWSHFVDRLRLSPPAQFESGLRWLKNPSRDKNVKLIVRLLYQTCLYLIWRERNSRIHSGNTRQPGALIPDIKQLIRLRLDPLSRAQVLKQGEISVLSAWFVVF